MRSYVYVLGFFLLFHFTVSGQNSREGIDEKLTEVKQLDGDPGKAIKILSEAKNDSKSIGYRDGFVKSGSTLSLFYSRENDYEKVIKTCNEIESEAKKLGNDLILSDLYRMRALAYANLGFTDLSQEGFRTALKYAGRIESKDKRHYKLSLTYENLTIYYDHKKFPMDTIIYYLDRSLQEAEKIDDKSKDVPINYKYDMIGSLYLNMGLLYMDYDGNPKMDLAETYFMKALELYNNKEYKMFEVNQVALLTYIGRFYHTQKKYAEAVQYLKKAIRLEKKVKTPYVRKEAYELLSKSYLELDSLDASIFFLNLFTSLNDSLNIVNTLEAGISLNKIVSKKEEVHKSRLKNMILIALVGVSFFIVVVWLFWRKKKSKMQKDYELLIEQLKKEKTAFTKQPQEIDLNIVPSENDILLTGANIADETLENILLKLERFEKTHQYLKQEITLTHLAGAWNTNTNYLSQVIKQYKGKSFNNYLNELRINYIVKLLYSESKYREYKISYLGETCGFSSREVFTRAFKKETGFSPSYFLENLKKSGVIEN